MNLFYVLLTAVTVSVDSFVAGFSLSLNKKNGTYLPSVVAAVTYVLCLAACLAGNLLRHYLQSYVDEIGSAILIFLGAAALCKKESETTLERVKFSHCFAIGVGVGLDGAAASLSLALQGLGNAVTLPALFAATHFVTVFLGQILAKSAKPENANIFSAVMFFTLAAIKLM